MHFKIITQPIHNFSFAYLFHQNYYKYEFIKDYTQLNFKDLNYKLPITFKKQFHIVLYLYNKFLNLPK